MYTNLIFGNPTEPRARKSFRVPYQPEDKAPSQSRIPLPLRPMSYEKITDLLYFL